MVMKTRQPKTNSKYGGKPCPPSKKWFEVSNCEKEGLADNSVPDCDDNKEDKPSSWSEWGHWSSCMGICGEKGKVILFCFVL